MAEVECWLKVGFVTEERYCGKHGRAAGWPCQYAECPDDGACHHRCGSGACFRVLTCAPLSGAYGGEFWPAEVLAEHRARPSESVL